MGYFRIMNGLDADMLSVEIKNIDVGKSKKAVDILSGRIFELAELLDMNYGAKRGMCSMGGYILYFPDTDSYEKWIEKINTFYGINPESEEYEDIICTMENVVWKEKLFLLSSDDAIVIVYPEKRKKCQG